MKALNFLTLWADGMLELWSNDIVRIGSTNPVEINGSDLNPSAAGLQNLGTYNRWRRLYCTMAVDVSSDARLKRDIKDLDGDLIMCLRPRQYRLIAEPDKVHFGLIAQEVKAALDECGIEDADVYDDENPDSLSLRYEELIAPLIATVQRQQAQIDALEQRMKELGGCGHEGC